MKTPENKLFNLNIVISNNEKLPVIELRKVVKMNEENKQIFLDLIKAAYNETPIIVMPTFSNKLLSISAMLKKGWIAEDRDDLGNIQYKILFE